MNFEIRPLLYLKDHKFPIHLEETWLADIALLQNIYSINKFKYFHSKQPGLFTISKQSVNITKILQFKSKDQ